MIDNDFNIIPYNSKTPRIQKNQKKIKENNIKDNKKCIKWILLSILITFILGGLVTLIILRIKKYYRKKGPQEPIKILISDLSYEESKSMLNFQIIDSNNRILNKTLKNIDNLLLICQNNNLSEINTKLNYSSPSFLENPTKGALKIIKSDIEFYGRKYTELSEEANNFTALSIEFLKNLSYLMESFQNELNYTLYQFQDLIKNISIPLVSRKKLFKDMRILDDQNIDEKFSFFYEIEEYKNETEKLNNIYNKMFNYFDESVKIINSEIMEFPSPIIDLQNEVEEGMSKFEEIVSDFKDPDDIENFHKNLKIIKKNLVYIKEKLVEKMDIIENRIKEIENAFINDRNKYKLEKIKDESNQILQNIILKSNSIRIDIIEQAKKKYSNLVEIPEFYASNILFDLLDKSLTNSAKAIVREERTIYDGFNEAQTLINVEEKTSLDLLFIMDTTGSMDPYISQVKNNLVNIINKIVLECPGIDLNIGFIGYKDIDHTAKYYDIDFTQSYEELKKIILNVVTTPGYDDPEDVEGAMEMALNKTWKNNARFIIFVGDVPCHGKKYHKNTYNWIESYPNGIPYRKNIEESIKELAEKNISLLCMKLTSDTDEMFAVFNNIYKNYKKCKYDIVPLNSLNDFTNIVIDSSVDIYVNQRNIQ